MQSWCYGTIYSWASPIPLLQLFLVTHGFISDKALKVLAYS